MTSNPLHSSCWLVLNQLSSQLLARWIYGVACVIFEVNGVLLLHVRRFGFDCIVSIYLYISVYLFLYPYIYLPIYLFIYLSISMYLCVSKCISICIYLPIYLSIYLSMYPSIYLFISIYPTMVAGPTHRPPECLSLRLQMCSGNG